MPFIFSAETVFKKGHYGDDNFVLTEHDPNDSGGTTRYGVDLASHHGVDVEHLTKQQATDIYWNEWNHENIESFSYPFGECFFDCAVNAGVGRAKKIQAKTGNDPIKFMDERVEFYKRLAAAVPKDREYLTGWLDRISNAKKYLKL